MMYNSVNTFYILIRYICFLLNALFQSTLSVCPTIKLGKFMLVMLCCMLTIESSQLFAWALNDFSVFYPVVTLRKHSASHWCMRNIAQESMDSSDDEFFDARGQCHIPPMVYLMQLSCLLFYLCLSLSFSCLFFFSRSFIS